MCGGDVRPHGAADGPALARAVVDSAVGEFLSCWQIPACRLTWQLTLETKCSYVG